MIACNQENKCALCPDKYVINNQAQLENLIQDFYSGQIIYPDVCGPVIAAFLARKQTEFQHDNHTLTPKKRDRAHGQKLRKNRTGSRRG